jgi:hypothetical protein
MPARSRSKRRTSRRPRRAWVHYTDDSLLDVRLCDLDLRVERTTLEPRIRQLYQELEDRGLRFRPHVWLSSEWFSPDGIPGIAIPFYLAHPRLMKLEARQMLEVEGGRHGQCMRILRHEAGHAIDTAFRLHYRKRWRETFGRYSVPYPRYYSPNPNSRNYVLHLDAWYAQVHPAEDFAETFAVWLTPRSSWRQRYADWPLVLRKLEYVDELMAEIAHRSAPVRSRARIDPLPRLKTTLGQHYRAKQRHYSREWSSAFDRDLSRLFSQDPRYANRPTAASFLRGLRPEICETVSQWTGAHRYTVDQIVQELSERCRELKLRLALPPREARTQAVIMLTVQTMNFMRAGRYEIPV